MTAWLSPQKAGPSRLPSAVTRPKSGLVAKACDDRPHVGLVTEQVTEEPLPPGVAGARQVAVLSTPGAAFGMDLEE